MEFLRDKGEKQRNSSVETPYFSGVRHMQTADLQTADLETANLQTADLQTAYCIFLICRHVNRSCGCRTSKDVAIRSR